MTTVDEQEEPSMDTHATPPAVRLWHTDPLLDVEGLKAAARGEAVYGLGFRPTLTVAGKDRTSWLNGLLTCDVANVGHGVGAWGLLLDRVGKVQSVLAVVAQGERLLLGVLWGDAHDVHHQLDMRLVMEDAELEIVEDWHWSVALGAQHQAPNDAAAWGNVTLAGPCALIAEPSFTGGGVRHALSDAAWALWRMRSALPWGGIDFDASSRPHEAALDRKAVSWSKGCYLGQEVVCMQDMRGKVKKRLAVFTTNGDAYAAQTPTAVVSRGGTAVGRVTSAVYEPVERRWTLFALVPTAALPESAVMHSAHETATANAGNSDDTSATVPKAYETDLVWETSPGVGLHLGWIP